MSDPKVSVIIPFRDRGIDPRRGVNLDVVRGWWWAALHLDPVIISDGLEGDAQFNRHRAYNRAVSRNTDADVFVFAEADMLVPEAQIHDAVLKAAAQTGLVVPFTQYRYLSDATSDVIRDVFEERGTKEIAKWWAMETDDPRSVFSLTPESMRDNGKAIGAISVVSARTLEITHGFTEATHGNWYDDNITAEGFHFLTGHKTRHVKGPAVHLYHLPGWTGDHLTDADRQATLHNRELLYEMRHVIRRGDKQAVRELMAHRAV